ncbi:MAG: carbohydrate ABC transporter permease [Gemmatimonadota bacterium]
MKRPLARAALFLALGLGTVISLGPLLWMLSASFMTTGEASSSPPPLWPHHPTFDHYRDMFERLALGRYFRNSLLNAVGATLGALFVCSLAGYALAKLRFRGRDRIFQTLVAMLVVPAQVGMLPLFMLLRELGLVNTYVGVILPSIASIYAIFLIRQYTLGVPDELLDAARLDGASEWLLFRRIVLPVIAPILVTLAIFTFLGTWNDFLWPLIILADDRWYTLPVGLANLSLEHVQDPELMLAGAVVTVAPVLIVFVALQRYYLQGIMMGSVKG